MESCTKVEKPWGVSRSWTVDGREFQVNSMRAGGETSLHRHERSHTLCVLSGVVKVETPGTTSHIRAGAEVMLSGGVVHRISSEHGAVFLEEYTAGPSGEIERFTLEEHSAALAKLDP